MLKIKKILGILLALCFVMSVTAAAASAAPYVKNGPNYKDGKNKYDNHYNNGNNYGKNKYDNHYNNGNHYGKTKHYKQGYWGHKKVRHNPDRHHKSHWYSNDRYWFPGYWY